MMDCGGGALMDSGWYWVQENSREEPWVVGYWDLTTKRWSLCGPGIAPTTPFVWLTGPPIHPDHARSPSWSL
jgi:hypothetical protein